MVNHFPELIDPYKFARLGEHLIGKYEVARMKRLVTSLDNDSGNVEFDLIFDRKERARIATGGFKTEVKMICQRCLNQVNVAVQGEVQLEFVVVEEGGESLARLEDQGYDTVLVENDSLSLAELIEDEVLLALPFSPLHEIDECPDNAIVEKLQITDNQPARPNPFAELAKLKKDQE